MADDPTTPPESFGARAVRVMTAAAHAVLGTEPEHAALMGPTYVRATDVTHSTVSLSWHASNAPGRTVHYSVFYRGPGATRWSVGAVSSGLSATVTGLKPETEYEFEIFAHVVP